MRKLRGSLRSQCHHGRGSLGGCQISLRSARAVPSHGQRPRPFSMRWGGFFVGSLRLPHADSFGSRDEDAGRRAGAARMCWVGIGFEPSTGNAGRRTPRVPTGVSISGSDASAGDGPGYSFFSPGWQPVQVTGALVSGLSFFSCLWQPWQLLWKASLRLSFFSSGGSLASP